MKQYRFKICHPQTNSALNLKRETDKKILKKTDKYHIFAPTAGTSSTIFPKLCTVIEDIETIKKVVIFQSKAYFFLQGAWKNSG